MRWMFGLATLGVLVSPAAAQSLAPRPYSCEQSQLRGRNFYQCPGAVRGRKGLVRSLTLGRKRYLPDEVWLLASRQRLPKLMTWGPKTATAWVAVERGLALKLPSARKHLAPLAAQSVRFFGPGRPSQIQATAHPTGRADPGPKGRRLDGPAAG
ncbi:MAG: hypothetical protein ABI333_18430 [bacterium]